MRHAPVDLFQSRKDNIHHITSNICIAKESKWISQGTTSNVFPANIVLIHWDIRKLFGYRKDRIFLAAKLSSFFFRIHQFKVLLLFFNCRNFVASKLWKNFFSVFVPFHFFSLFCFSLKNLSNWNSGKIHRILKFPFEAEGCCRFIWFRL